MKNIDINSLNSGDKFLLTMTNTEIMDLFHSLGLKKMSDFNRVMARDVWTTREERLSKFFEVFGLDYPSNINVYSINYHSRGGIFSLEFILTIPTDDNKEAVIYYTIYYNTHNRKPYKVGSYIDSERIGFGKGYDNYLNPHSRFYFEYRVPSYKSWVPLIDILNDSINYYNTYFPGFSKFVEDFNNKNLEVYMDKWKYKEFNTPFYVNLVFAPVYYSRFYNNSLLDYDTFFGFITATERSESSGDNLKKVLGLLENGKKEKASKIIKDVVDSFFKDYISSDSELQKFKSTLSELRDKVSKYIEELSIESGIHSDFIRNGWNLNEMPVDISESIQWNAKNRKK